MKRILIVFASSHGQTRTIAERIAASLRVLKHDVATADAAYGAPSPEAYDAVILGSRIQFGKHADSIVRYVATHRAALSAMRTAFFSVSNSAAQAGADRDPHDYMGKFFEQVRWQPGDAVAFGGAIKYRRYGVILRYVMKQLARAGGHPTDTSRDHELTVWTAVDRFIAGFASALDAPTGGPPRPPRSIRDRRPN